jgi:hypothetical protein
MWPLCTTGSQLQPSHIPTRNCLYILKGPKHDQVGCEFFYIKRTRMVRWLGDWWKKLFLFLFGEDNRHFVFLANAEHTLKIIKCKISIRLTFFSVSLISLIKRMLSIICRNFKKGVNLSLHWVYAIYFLASAEHALKNFKLTISMR